MGEDTVLDNVAPFQSHPNPFDRCPKCGQPESAYLSSQWTVAYERRSAYPREVLVWTCQTCGYDVRTFPADVR